MGLVASAQGPPGTRHCGGNDSVPQFPLLSHISPIKHLPPPASLGKILKKALCQGCFFFFFLRKLNISFLFIFMYCKTLPRSCSRRMGWGLQTLVLQTFLPEPVQLLGAGGCILGLAFLVFFPSANFGSGQRGGAQWLCSGGAGTWPGRLSAEGARWEQSRAPLPFLHPSRSAPGTFQQLCEGARSPRATRGCSIPPAGWMDSDAQGGHQGPRGLSDLPTLTAVVPQSLPEAALASPGPSMGTAAVGGSGRAGGWQEG